MKRNGFRALLALLLVFAISGGALAISVENEVPASGVHLTAERGDTVLKLSVSLVGAEGVTNGRIAVTYDPAELTFDRVKVDDGTWIFSVNDQEAKSGRIFFAWVNSKLKNEETPVASFYFTSSGEASERTVTVGAGITELYRGSTAVELESGSGSLEVPKGEGRVDAGEIPSPTEPGEPSGGGLGGSGAGDSGSTGGSGGGGGSYYVDVPADHWAMESIYKATAAGIFQGTSADPSEPAFSPMGAVDRAQFITIIYRMAGSPEVSGVSPFADVTPESYYAAAVQWGYENGVVNGVSEGCYDPTRPISRQEMVTILYRYADKILDKGGEGSDLSAFSDADAVQDWAEAAMRWAVENGYIQGSYNALRPQSGTVRAEAATVVCRFLGL